MMGAVSFFTGVYWAMSMKCRPHCGACCVAPSISQPLPGMPDGKPAGVACKNLDPESFSCMIWGSDIYPTTCKLFQPSLDCCGADRVEALFLIGELEQATRS
jgi:hypothetical protein